MAQTARLVIEIDSREAERRSQALRTELSSIQRTGDYASRSMDQMSVATRQLAGYMAGLITVGAAVSKMDIYTGLNNRIKLVTSSQQDLNQALKDTFNIAQATGQAWDSTAQVYQRFADNAKRLGITLQQTASLTDTVAKAISISGGSAASAEAALVQFGQALASGVLRGEEFNSIAEQAPALLKAIATGLNTNIGALRGMAAEGKLTGEVVIQALTKAKTSVDDLFGKTDFTIGQSITQLSNAVTQFVGEAGKGSGAAQALSGSIQLLANNLETVTNIAMIGGAYWMGTLIPVMYKSVVASAEKVKALLAENQVMNAAIVQTQRKAQAEYNAAQANVSVARAAVAAAEMEVNSNRAVIQSEIQRIQATIAATNAEKAQEAQSLSSQITDKGRAMSISRMATLQKSQALMTAELTALEQKLASTTVASSATYTAARNTQTVATERLTVATSELNVANSLTTRSSVGLLAALGGSVGLGIAVAGVATTYLLLKDNTDSATEALDVQKISVRELTEEYQKMSLAKLLTEIDSLKSKLADAKKTQSKALIELQAVAPSLGNQSTDKQRKQAEVLNKIIKDLRNEAITTDKALQQMSKAGFSDDQLTRASKAFVKFDEFADTISIVNAQLGLAESSSSKATEGYESTSKQIAELNKEYGRLNSRLNTSSDAFETTANLNLTAGTQAGASATQFKQASDALEKFTKGQLSASEVAQVFNANLPIPKETIDSFIKQAAKIDDNKSALNKVNSELKKQNSLRDTYLKQSQGILAARRNETEEVNKQASAQERLNALKANYSQKNLEADFITLNTKLFGGNKAGLDQAIAVSEFYKENKIPMTRSLSGDEWRVFEKQYNKQAELKKLQESITDSEREQTREEEKQLKIAERQAVLLAGNDEKSRNMLRVYQAFRNAGLGDKQARVMTAQVGRENDFRKDAMFGSHKDANNGYTNTGFISWQKSRSAELMKFLQGQGVLDKNGKIQQTQDSLDAMAKFLMQEITTVKSYSRSKNALLDDNLSYRELEKVIGKNFIGWDYDGKKLGKGKASQHLSKQDNYYDQISKILGNNPDNVMGAIKNLSKFEDEAFKARAKTLEEIKQLQGSYDSETVLRNKQREEEINQATILGQTQLIPKIKERYDAQEQLAQKQFDFETNGYEWTEAKKLKYTYETNGLKLVAEGKLTEEQRKIAIDSFTLQQQQELGLLKLAQEQRLFQAELFMMSEMERTKKRYALEYSEIAKIMDLEERRRKMSAFQAEFIRGGVGRVTDDKYDTSGQFLKSRNYDKPQQTAMQSLDEDYAQTYQKLQDNLTAVLESERASYQERLEAERIFKEARQQMEDEYYLKAADARKSDYENQLQLYNQVLSATSTTWGSLTQIVKDARGENSSSFKAMFVAQQSFAAASAIISAHLAAVQVAADATIPFFGAKIAASKVMLAMGYANAGIIAGQTIAGFADGGYTGKGGKYEVAGSVHKGEIVWSQDDIKRWGGVNLVESMRKSSNPEAFLNNNNVSADNIMRRALMSSNAFMESQKKANIFNQSRDNQIIYKANQATESSKISTGSDLYHDGKVYFSPNGLVQDRSNLEDVYDFTLGRSARPQAEAMASVQPTAPTINFKIEVVNQVRGVVVEAEQLDESTVRLIVKDELKKELPREVPKIVSDQIKEPNSSISRAISTNTTARRNR